MWPIIESLVDMVYPRVCPVCGCSLARSERLMCVRCLMDVPRTRMHLNDDNSIVARLATPRIRLSLAAAWMYYRVGSPYIELVRDAKYRHMPGLSRECGRQFAREMLADGTPQLADIDVLLPVPIHWTRLLRRGFNQSEEVARGIGEVAGIPVGDNLGAMRGHRTQTRQSRDERLRNVKGITRVRYPDELAGLHVAVVDDVITTGATMADALRALTEATTPRALSVLSVATVRASEWGMAE